LHPLPRTGKPPFDIVEVVRRLRIVVASFAKAALFKLAADGHETVFEVLVACIISIRTRDETTVPVARALFTKGRTPAEVVELSVIEIDRLIAGCTFHEPKAKTIRDIAAAGVRDHGGDLPCDAEVLMGFRGVGPKCANLTLGIACNQPLIGVDIHVHRVTNRWGYIATSPRRRPRRKWPPSRRSCRNGIGSRSTRYWCRLGSTSARVCGRSARRAGVARCVSRWG
jgi:endonuclease-3